MDLRRILREERGQFAFPMLIGILVIFAIGALALDVGLWYFAHRDAQNDADAAALAGALKLPTDDTGKQSVIDAVSDILQANGEERAVEGTCPTSNDHSYVQFSPKNAQGKYDQVTVCTRRQIGGMLASLSGINFVHISARSTAMAGPANGSNVMPWAVVAKDPTCDAPGKTCNPGDLGGTCPFEDANNPANACPFGLRSNIVYTFKQGNGGNTGIIRVCGSGGSSYRDCLSGASSSGFYAVGESVFIDTQPGTISNATDNGLSQRKLSSAWASPGRTNCDVVSKPALTNTAIPGLDVAGKAAATATFVNNASHPECIYRLVPIPILRNLPPNGEAATNVIGVASFGVASWDRVNGNGKVNVASPSQATCHEVNKNQVGANDFICGDAWGYLFTGVTPPQALLQRIGGDNPFAPILIALTN